MMVIPYKAEHLMKLKMEGHVKEPITWEQAKFAEERSTWNLSVWADDGELLLVGGIHTHWECRGEAWAAFNRRRRRDFIAVHNLARRYLDVAPFMRIEMTVESEYEDGHRWARALGFKLEALRMPFYFPNGKEAALYARVA